MATQEQNAQICQQCGATLAAGLRYCVHCYSPVGATASRAHVELARKTATTHRPDPTLVFSPEKHEAIVRRARSRKRMIVTATIALAAVVAGSIALNMINRGRREAQKTMARELAAHRELNALAEALDRFRADVDRYPTNEEGLRCLARKPAAFEAAGAGRSSYWFGPYLENVPEVDPWGNDYVYHTVDGGRSFELYSPGPGGEEGSDSRFRVRSQTPAEADR
jgi:general secretion pathway protein G